MTILLLFSLFTELHISTDPLIFAQGGINLEIERVSNFTSSISLSINYTSKFSNFTFTHLTLSFFPWTTFKHIAFSLHSIIFYNKNKITPGLAFSIRYKKIFLPQIFTETETQLIYSNTQIEKEEMKVFNNFTRENLKKFYLGFKFKIGYVF